MRMSIILPCYNEELNVKRFEPELIIPLLKKEYKLEIIAVDDGSTDHTFDALQKLKKKYRFIKITRHDGNQGLGKAIRSGIANATAPVTITLDADFTFHPREIPKLVQRYVERDVDVVIGSPFLGKADVLLHRKMISASVNFLYNMLLWKRISSVSPIFRLYRTSLLKRLDLTTKGFDINAEILFKLLQRKARLTEIPVTLSTRKYGVSKLNTWKEVKNHIRLLKNILKWKLT